MLTDRINLKNFKIKKRENSIKKNFLKLIKENNEILNSLSVSYINKFNKTKLNKYKKFGNFRLIGMGGSILGAQAIYNFLNDKVKKKFNFVDNLQFKQKKNNQKKFLNLIISKSGNTIETIANTNILIKKKDKNVFITENKKNYLNLLAHKLKSDIIHHNNFIGGRYSVLSEVGMLPAELMGLKSKDFKQFNSLVKNKFFFNALLTSVNSTIYFLKKKKFNSIIINYDEKSDSLFKWYQQLVAESLGKKGKGLLPIISTMPKDNHSVMQLYLDGFKNNFFTFFYVFENKSDKIKSNSIFSNFDYLKGKKISDILYSQKKATENIFNKKKFPFRSFEIIKRNEKSLGELFCFFILETILIGKSMNLNPYDQPAVELIKTETKKNLV